MAKSKHDSRNSEARREQRRRRRRRFWIRCGIFVAVLALVITSVIYWDAIAPDVLMGKISSLFTGSSGGFPVNVAGIQMYQMESADGCTVLLSDTYVTMLNSNGSEVMRRSHAFASPQLRTAGKYILVAETGGKRLHLETRAKTVYTMSVNYDILVTAVHKNGNFAVVTAAEQGYNATLSVYSSSGKLLYQRLCSNLVADIAFSPNGRDIAMVTVGAVGGATCSSVEVVSLNSDQSETKYTHSGTDILLCRVQYLSDSLIAAVGDTAVWMYQPKKEKCATYAVADGDLTAFAIGDDGVLAVTKPYGSTTGANVAYIRSNGAAAFTAAVDGACRDVAVSGNRYSVLTDSHLYQIGNKGIIGSMLMQDTGKLVSMQGSRVAVLGLQDITQYSAPTHLNENS